MKFGKIASMALGFALAFTLAGCTQSSSTYVQAVLDDAPGVRVEAENAGSDQEATTEGAIEVKDGDVIVISPDTEKGSFHLTIANAQTKEVIYDDNVEGRVMYTIGAMPGSYNVTTSGNDVTGSMLVFAQSGEELLAQNESLAEATDAAKADAEAPAEEAPAEGEAAAQGDAAAQTEGQE